jgi:hypothetical protein
MDDGVLVWAKKQRVDWERRLRGLMSGALRTSELRNEKYVDTTDETIAEQSERIAELDALIARHEVDDA